MRRVMILLHLSDFHIGTPKGGRERLEAVLDSLVALHGPGSVWPAVLAVATGDIGHDDYENTYPWLRDRLAALPFPVVPMIGNHDDRDAFRRHFGGKGFVQETRDTPAGRLVTLDTHSPGEAGGRLCRARLDWLARELDEAEGPIILALHHPPMRVGIPGFDAIGLRDAPALLEVLRPHRARIRAMLHGHVHRDIAGTWHGIPSFGVRGTASSFALDFRPGQRLRPTGEAPGYAVLRLDGEEVLRHGFAVPDSGPTAD